METNILHIGGGRLQLPALRWARDAGHTITMTDAHPDAPGRSVAQRFECIDARDTDALVALAQELDRHGDFVGAYAPDRTGIEAVAAIGAATGTPANSVAAVRAALDLDGSLARLSAAHIPVALRGSHEPEDLEFDVDAVLRDGAFLQGGILRRIQTIDGVSQFGFMEPALDRDERRSIYNLVEHSAQALDLTTGPLGAHITLRRLANGERQAHLRELLPCLRAEITNTIAPLAVGKSPAQAWFAALQRSGGPFDDMPAFPDSGAESPRAGWMAIRAQAPGVLAGIEGLERARATSGIEGLCILAKKGDELPDPRDERSLVGYLFASGWNTQEVEKRLRMARERLRIRVHAVAA